MTDGVHIEPKKVVIDLERHPELHEPGGILYVRDAGVIVVRGKRKHRAFSSACPHKPKKKYKVFPDRIDPRKPCFRCAVHDWSWDHKGRATGRAKRPLERLPVERSNGHLIVRRG